MTTINALGLVLLVLMVLVGGKQGGKAFVSLLLNFGFLYLAMILIAFHVPPMGVTIGASVILLAITIFMGEDDLTTTVSAFYASLLVLAVMILLIMASLAVARSQGFGSEDSDELEGMSVLIGLSYQQIAVCTTVLSTLGAIAEAAMAIASGLQEILLIHPNRSTNQLFGDGMRIGEQIIGTTLNTLFFGFFGGFLALFIWFVGLKYSLGTIMNNKIFVSEMITVLVSFVSVLLTVPATTAIMALRRSKIVAGQTDSEGQDESQGKKQN